MRASNEAKASPALKPRQLDLYELTEALRASWQRETSYDPLHWFADNPSWGRCAVTSLIVQDFFGGVLLKAQIQGQEHFWNRLDNELDVDLTRSQFGDGAVPMQSPRETQRQDILSYPDTLRRYELLRDAVLRRLT